MKTKLIFLFLWIVVACDTGNSKNTTSSDDIMATEAHTPVFAELYQCPMHPHFTSHDSTVPCPICGMSLVKAENEPKESNNTSITVSSEIIQSTGIRAKPAKVMMLKQTLRAFGSVETDERRENVNVARLEGWINQLQINAEGDSVRRGALLYRVYSPDLIAAQKDLLNSVAIGNEKRIAAIRQRLKSLGMQDKAIATVLDTQKVIEQVPVYAEAGGTVASLSVREGDYIKPGTPIMRLQSYENVWVIASIPEQDLALVRPGLIARLKFPSAPSASTSGSIDYIYPTIDVNTRTGKVRIEVDNNAGLLRPGAYADIVFEITDKPRLSIPTEAILRDSRGAHVILELEDGRYGSQDIETGIASLSHTEIVDGLTEGQRVVVSGQFMLDSEVNLREGLSKLSERSSSGSTEQDAEEDMPRSHNHSGGHRH